MRRKPSSIFGGNIGEVGPCKLDRPTELNRRERIMRRAIHCLPLLIVALLVLGDGTSTPLAQASDWPQWLGPNRDGVWRETGLVEKFPPGGPKVIWRTPIDTGYSGPAVANGRVYVMDRERAKGPDGKPLRVSRSGVPGKERILCLDAANGKII